MEGPTKGVAYPDKASGHLLVEYDPERTTPRQFVLMPVELIGKAAGSPVPVKLRDNRGYDVPPFLDNGAASKMYYLIMRGEREAYNCVVAPTSPGDLLTTEFDVAWDENNVSVPIDMTKMSPDVSTGATGLPKALGEY